PASDEHRVGELDQSLERLDLPGDLRAAEERDERTLGRVGYLLQELDLLRQQQPACRAVGREEARQRIDRRVRAVAGAECVVQIDVAQLAQLLGERLVVLLLFSVKAK